MTFDKSKDQKITTERLKALSAAAPGEHADILLRLGEVADSPVDILVALPVDQATQLKALEASNPNTTLEIVSNVVESSDQQVRLMLAAETGLHSAILEKLAQDRDPDVRNRALRTLEGDALEKNLQNDGFVPKSGQAERLGDLLVAAGLIDTRQLKKYVKSARESLRPLGRVLVEQQIVQPEQIVKLLKLQAQLRRGEISIGAVVEQLKELMPKKTGDLDEIREANANFSLKSTLPISASLSSALRSALSQTQPDPDALQQVSSSQPETTSENLDSHLDIHSLIDAVPEGIIIYNSRGRVLAWNRQAESIFGVHEKEAAGRLITDFMNLIGSDGLPNVLEPHSSDMLRKPIELAAQNSTGERFPMEVTVVCAQNPCRGIHVSFFKDISDQKHFELRRWAQYEITRVLSVASSMAEAAQRVIPVIAQTIGWDLAEIYMVNEESEMLERIEVWHAPKSKLRTHSVEKARLFKKGQGLPGHVWMSGRAAWIDNIQARALTSTPVDNSVVAALCLPISAQNSFLGVLMFCSSKITRPDKDSLDLLTSLCTQIGQFMQRLKDQEARQHLMLVKQKEDFIATLAHDLKTPLVSADRILELMTNGALGTLQPNQAEILSKLRESNNALLRMVQNLLALYRYESGVEALFVERTNFNALATTCAAEIRPVADNKKIKINVTVPEHMEPIYIDSLAMRRVITNLLSNAIKFTNEGGIIQLEAKLIDDGGWLQLDVQDNGIGVAPEDLEHLFKRFWQGNQKNRAIGTGLGLHLCWNIVQAHKGSITCTSEVGKGTKFTVLIPAKLQEHDAIPRDPGHDTTTPLPVVTMPGNALGT